MLLQLIRQAVADSMGGGRVGCVLSGGVDSSTVTQVALQLDPDIPTFTGYYATPGFDERHWARLAAGRDHHEILITPSDFVDHFDGMCRALRPPYQGMGTFGQYMVARYAAQHVDVVLSGEGGDELFGGYARLLIVAGEQPPVGYEDYRLPDGYPRTLEDALAHDFDRLGDLLAVDDQVTRAFGLEARAPFTDLRVVDWVLAQPARSRVGKRLLKDAVRGLVPDEILQRHDKMGMPIPLVQWAQTDPVRSFAVERVGWLPDPQKPWDRDWWYEMLNATVPVP